MNNFLISLTLFSLPAYFLRLALWPSASINLLDLLLAGSLLASMWKLRADYKNGRLSALLKRQKWTLFFTFALLLSLLISYLSNLDNGHWADGLGLMKSYFLLPMLFGFGVSLLVRFGRLNFPLVAWALFLSIGAQAVLGYYYLLKDYLTYDNRLVFIYGSPNYYAILLAIGIILGIHLLKNIGQNGYRLTKSKSWDKVTILLLLAACCFALLKSESLGAWLGLTVALSFYLLATTGHRTAAKMLVAGILAAYLAILVMVFNLESLLNFANYAPTTPPTSADSRVAIYLSGVRILADNLIWGIGLANFQELYLAYQEHFPPYPQWAVPHAHNLILHLWIEGGLLAAFALSCLASKSLLNKKTALAPAAVFAVIVYFLAHGLIDVPLWKNDLAVIFWTFLSLALFNKK